MFEHSKSKKGLESKYGDDGEELVESFCWSITKLSSQSLPPVETS